MFRVYDGIRRGSGARVRARYITRRGASRRRETREGQMFSIFKNTCATICAARDILAPPRSAGKPHSGVDVGGFELSSLKKKKSIPSRGRP